jgi:hypothetical protein
MAHPYTYIHITVAQKSNYFEGTAPPTPTRCPHQIFFLWGHIKDIAYRSSPRNLDGLKPNMGLSNITADISPMTFRAVSARAICLVRLCMQHAGAYFQHYLQRDIF